MFAGAFARGLDVGIARKGEMGFNCGNTIRGQWMAAQIGMLAAAGDPDFLLQEFKELAQTRRIPECGCISADP